MFLTWQEFCAGWVGGVFGLVFGHPFDTVRIRQQLTKSSITHATKITFRYEGFSGFYKGMLFPLATIGINNAVFFGLYANALRFLQPEYSIHDPPTLDPNWQLNVFCAGCFGSMFQVFITNPVEIVKIRLQARTGNTNSWGYNEPKEHKVIDNVMSIYKSGGLKGFYRGFVPMIYRDVPASGLYVWSYVGVEEYLKEKNLSPFIRHSIAGGAAGIISWVPVIPFDVVKSRMQADSVAFPKYKNMLDCMKQSYRAEGLSLFGKGFTLTCVRAILVNAAVFVGYEQCLSLIN